MRRTALLALLAALAPLPARADPTLDQRLEALIADVEVEVGDVPVIRADDLRIAVAGVAPPTLLDVRSDEERAVSVIAGAAGGLPGRLVGVLLAPAVALDRATNRVAILLTAFCPQRTQRTQREQG